MKLRHRALTLLLTVAMMLTFMPAMAFAAHDVEAKGVISEKENNGLPEDTAEDWWITNNYIITTLYEEETTLTVETNLPDSAAPTYQWYVGYEEYDDEYYYFSPIDGAEEASYVAREPGAYACAVYSEGEVRVGHYYVNGEESNLPWYLEYEYGSVVYLEDGNATMTFYPYYYGEGSPAYTYEWYKYDNNEWHQISGAAGNSCITKKTGNYRCEVTIDVDGKTEMRSIGFTVCDWRITNDDETVYFKYGSTANLTAETSYNGTDAEYQWYELGDEDWAEIEGATSKSYKPGINVEGEFLCEVTINGFTQCGWYYAEFDIDDYTYLVKYPNATAVYDTWDGRDLEIENGYAKFPEEGDTVTITHDGVTDIYTCHGDEEDGYGFCSDDKEWLYFDATDYQMIAPSDNKIDINFFTESIPDHDNKMITRKYDIETKLDVTVKTDIKSLRFEPASISLYSEDVKTTYDDGRVVYDFERRYHGKNRYGHDDYRYWINGDKLVVAYKDGSSRVFIYDANEDEFVSNDDHYAYPDVENWELKEGNNDVRIWYRGACCTIKVFLDSPSQKAARDKAARDAAAEKAAAEKAAASNINKATVTAADIKLASDLGATSVTLGASVKKIQKNAFKGTNITYVEVKTKKLKAKSVKGSLKGSKVKTIKVNVGNKKANKQYVKKYKSFFTKKNAGKKAKVK